MSDRHDRNGHQHHPPSRKRRFDGEGSPGHFRVQHPAGLLKWQRGTALPTVDNLVVLAAVFGVKIDDILIFQGCGVIQISA